MNVIKLCRRHKGHASFKYAVHFPNSTPKFNDARVWCWETFGPSTELWNMRAGSLNGRGSKVVWSWITYERITSDAGAPRIFLEDDEHLALFQLAVGQK